LIKKEGELSKNVLRAAQGSAILSQCIHSSIHSHICASVPEADPKPQGKKAVGLPGGRKHDIPHLYHHAANTSNIRHQDLHRPQP